MAFNSYIFIFIFFPLTLAGYWGIQKLGKPLPAKVWLLISSAVFLGYANLAFLPIIAGSIAVNYSAGYLMSKGIHKKIMNRKLFLVIGLIFDIGLLLYCKYTNFFLSTMNSLFFSSYDLINIILPLGISFYTFQQIGFLVDRYKGETPDYSLLDYSLFVSFFPTVTSGPITMHNILIPQFNDKLRHNFNSESFARGIYVFAMGLAKKVLLADLFAGVADWGFATDPATLGTVNAVLVMLSYTLQLYFDFSGYSDMACGIALMLNLELPFNFDSPYRSLNINEFWKCWHITLTQFLTQYVYFPLGGNRKGKLRTYINIMIVFLLSGLWHGANYTFIIWGAMHGLASVISRIFKKQMDKWQPVCSWISTFLFVNIAWVFFRAESIGHAVGILKALLSMRLIEISSDLVTSMTVPEINLLLIFTGKDKLPLILYPALFFIGIWICVNSRNVKERMEKFKPGILQAIATIVLIVWSILSLSNVSEFIYMNF